MHTLPLQLKLGMVLLVGKGPMAHAKHRLLVDMGAHITWLQSAPSEDQLAELTTQQNNPSTRFALVIIASTQPWCTQCANWARSQRLLLNQVDNPQQSDVYIPAIVKHGPLRIGIGSGGINPVLARLIRENIEIHLPDGISQLVAITKRWHKRVRDMLPDYRKRRLFWESILSKKYADRLIAHNLDTNEQDALIASWLDVTTTPSTMHNDAIHASFTSSTTGMVWVVGAGPGDPNLLSIAGLRALKTADIILHDLLISPHILQLARRDAHIEPVGRRTGQCAKPLDVLCQRIIELARQGNIVCRLKGGDPSLFARSAEELSALTHAEIPWKVIPGITTASAVAASLGLPLTHRYTSHALRFVTGHHNIDKFVRNPQETLVIYMGYRNLRAIATQLHACGEQQSLSIALVQNASCANQRHHITTLSQVHKYFDIFDLADGPVLVIVGETVRMALGEGKIRKHKSMHDKQHSCTFDNVPL